MWKFIVLVVALLVCLTFSDSSKANKNDRSCEGKFLKGIMTSFGFMLYDFMSQTTQLNTVWSRVVPAFTH